MDRRKFLIGSGAALATTAGLSKAGIAFGANGGNIPGYTSRNLNSDPKPLATQSNDLSAFTGAWTDTTLRHLLRRAMFGVPLAQFQKAQTLGGMNAVVSQLLSDLPLPAEPNAYVDSIVQRDQVLFATDPNAANQNQQHLEDMHEQQVANWWMDLILKENLSIREHMTLLWSNHFVTGTDVVKPAGYAYTYNQMLRKNALGNMKSFVHDVSVDPAMLLYLNGNQNYDGTPPGGTRGGKGLNINENYARELQELFTMGIFDPDDGVTPNYSETDVQQAAKALTGWGPSTTAPFQGVFYPNSHNNDQKTYLGQTGNWALDDIINIIFSYKGPDGNHAPGYTAAYWFCQKIYMEFVYYVPNPSVVKAMAALLLQSNWEIKPVLQALLQSDHFYDVNVQNAQLKSPINFIASLIREINLTYQPFSGIDIPITGQDKGDANINIYGDPNPTLSYLVFSVAGNALGQQLLQPPNVKGWPGGHNWISTGTFGQRESYSSLFVFIPPGLDGGAKAKGVKIEFMTPSKWVQAMVNYDQMTSHDMVAGLIEIVLNKTLGPNETDGLYSVFNPNKLPENDFYLTDKDISNFAITIANLPEFQLV